ncbi:hypothetical protein N7468_010279 [Penicillium chermesinum]|uniref:DUF7703 domain-containing protein n=1 Tax=Penicillium chermesinum TaxID=63820 RepID=A0A9W9NCD6_9EURO|nr:uncharacterized protein N7468_010279 [Penicillium chermesinum]KAJ5217271.1 hypothetical protein N7468_010279 [Penicillium chermesinum]KAJ6171118.1 hypothetical protein N7470_000185 [Penicillium chermesinum]
MSSITNGSKPSLIERANFEGFAQQTAVAALIGIAWYNALELIVLCFATFKRYGGLYFWCLLIASFSIIPFCLGYLLIIYNVYDNEFPVAMELVAWVGMVTGQSLVLWSRLHLVVQSPRILRITLIMIIVDAIVLHIPAAVLELGSHSNKSELFERGFNIFERVQLIGFSVQEVILSCLYSYEAVRLLQLRPRGHYRGTLVQLLVINLFMIAMDAAVIAMQFTGLDDVQFTLKAMVYSIKLKLEYAVLNKLVVFAEMSGSTSMPTDLSDFVDLSYHTHPPADSDSQAQILDAADRSHCTRVSQKQYPPAEP